MVKGQWYKNNSFFLIPEPCCTPLPCFVGSHFGSNNCQTAFSKLTLSGGPFKTSQRAGGEKSGGSSGVRPEFGSRFRRGWVRAKYYTPEITKAKFHWKMLLNNHWTIPVKIHWTSDNPLETTTDKRNFVGKCHWQSIGTCHWKSTTISEVLISGVRALAPSEIPTPPGQGEAAEFVDLGYHYYYNYQ